MLRYGSLHGTVLGVEAETARGSGAEARWVADLATEEAAARKAVRARAVAVARPAIFFMGFLLGVWGSASAR